MSELFVDPALLAVVWAAAARLPEGWTVELVEGQGAALELRLVKPNGHRLAGRTDEQRGYVWDKYRQFADLVFIEYARLCGGKGRRRSDDLAWGGNFTNAALQYLVGHFDLCGYRGFGRYQRPQEREKAPALARSNGKALSLVLD